MKNSLSSFTGYQNTVKVLKNLHLSTQSKKLAPLPTLFHASQLTFDLRDHSDINVQIGNILTLGPLWPKLHSSPGQHPSQSVGSYLCTLQAVWYIPNSLFGQNKSELCVMEDAADERWLQRQKLSGGTSCIARLLDWRVFIFVSHASASFVCGLRSKHLWF